MSGKEIDVIESLRTEWHQAKAKLADLLAQNEAAGQRITEIDGLTRGQGDKGGNPVTVLAEALIRGESVTTANMAPLFEERTDIRRRQKILTEAIRLQRITVSDCGTKLSLAVGQLEKPKYQELVKNHVGHLVALSKSISDMIAFRDSFEGQGLSFSLGVGHVHPFTRIGTLGDAQSRVNVFLKELKDAGWITSEEIDALRA